MRKEKIMDQFDGPRSIEEVLALARYGAGIKARVRPRLYKNPLEPGRKYASFRLCAIYSVRIGGRTSTFEKIYTRGHEVAPPRSAANGFMIANTRLIRDVRQMERLGVKCDIVPFIMTELLRDIDLGEFEPHKPYCLDQFAILASIGIPVTVSMTTNTRRLSEEDGKQAYELYAAYSIHCLGEDYWIETRHGQFDEDAENKKVERVVEVALQRLEMEQHKLRRVGVEIRTGRSWSGDKNAKRSFVLIKNAEAWAGNGQEGLRPSLQVV